MLSQTLRPKTLEEVAGQKEAKEIIKAILKNPENSPKCLIFSGGWGQGKTTLSRIVAKELNHIKDENYNILESPFYYELDSTVIGNVEEVRKLRDVFAVSYNESWRVVCFDESQSVSSVGQSALLKMLEETTGNTLYILATTDPQKLLPTIRSRALEVHFSPVPVNDILENLSHVADKHNIEISQKVKQIIADRSGGHMRNAHMLLDKFLLLGEEGFISSVHSALSLYVDFFVAIYNNDKEKVLSSLNLLTDIPKDILKEDWNTLIVESMKVSCGFDCVHEDIKRLMSTCGKDFSILSQSYLSSWVRDAFIDMPYFQVVFLNLYKVISGQLQRKNGTGQVKATSEENKFGKPVR